MSYEYSMLELGPYHSSLPGPMRLRLNFDGETVSSCQVETGFLHRGLEKVCELHYWPGAIVYIDHLDPEAAIFGELVFCLAIENIAELIIPARARAIRIILSELARISSHLFYFVRVAKTVGSETLVHYALRDREKILDLFELLTGARFSINFLRFGGVNADVTEGFIEKVFEVCDLMQLRTKEYNDLFTFNRSFLKRTACLAPLSMDQVLNFGITGPNARASGFDFDVRKRFSYLAYDQVDFLVPLGLGQAGMIGDVHDRFTVRLREIAQSSEIIKQILDNLPDGDYINPSVNLNSVIPPGESYSRVESSRGLLGCHVVSEGLAFLNRVQFRVPSMANFEIIPHLLKKIHIEDVPIVLASLDLSVAERDR